MSILQEPVVNKELASLDLSKVAALQQKRTLAFVNHFVVTTSQFLNHFMKQCEQKLMRFERKLEKVEAALILLETRLSSIPEVNNATSPQKPATKSEAVTPASPQPSETTLPPSQPVETPVEPTQSLSETTHGPEYDRFVKMVQVGVPLQAVKLKVSLEGLDPEVLEKILAK